MRIAIVIGVSDYYKGLNPLPSCKNDVKVISSLLKASEKYERIEVISEETSSIGYKQRLTDFFKKNQSDDIDELFFYFTGHGDFGNEEFYYLLPDFQESKRNMTSLQNSEIDNLIKSLNPKIVIKAVDACKSGIPYVKDSEEINTYIKNSGNNFKKCYFMHSSANTQNSYINGELSDFTDGFVRSIKEYHGKDIRYKDIADFIADSFRQNDKQTPHFIFQADLTEVFCEVTENVIESICLYTKNDETNSAESQEDLKEETIREKSLKDKIIEASREVKTADETFQILNRIKETVENFSNWGEVREFYNLKFSFPSYFTNSEGIEEVARLLRKEKEHYFFDLVYEDEEYEELTKPDMFAIVRGMRPEYVTRKRKKLTGFDLTEKYPYSQIVIEFARKYKSIKNYQVKFWFVTSDRLIKIFLCFTDLYNVGFEEECVTKSNITESIGFKLEEEGQIYSYFNQVLESVTKIVIDNLRKEFDAK